MTDKIIYYEDELNDDFAATRDAVKVKALDDGFEYERGAFWKAAAFVLHRIVAPPIVFGYCALRGIKVKNRKALRNISGGVFIYGNHTQNFVDALLPIFVSFHRRGYVIVNDGAVEIPFLKNLVQMLGAIPLPSSFSSMRMFTKCLSHRIEEGNAVVIYPEAHIWPYYNKIRPFCDNSFTYPIKYGAPALPFTVFYKKSNAPFFRPKITVYIGEPVYPDKSLPVAQARKAMRDAVYDQMCRMCEGSFEYIKYRKKDGEGEE